MGNQFLKSRVPRFQKKKKRKTQTHIINCETKTGLLLGHAHKSSAFFLTVTHYHILLCSITASFSCVNMKIQQVSKIVPHVICLILLYNLVPQKFYELLIWFLSYNSFQKGFTFLLLHADFGQEI